MPTTRHKCDKFLHKGKKEYVERQCWLHRRLYCFLRPAIPHMAVRSLFLCKMKCRMKKANAIQQLHKPHLLSHHLIRVVKIRGSSFSAQRGLFIDGIWDLAVGVLCKKNYCVRSYCLLSITHMSVNLTVTHTAV